MSIPPTITPATELIARAVIVTDEHLLLARQRGKAWFFLPGGHVDPGEGAGDALLRELREELGAAVRITGFAGAVEHTYTDDGISHRELNLVFAVELTDTAAATSHEDHLDVTRVPVAQLANTDLRPSPLKDALLAWTDDRVPFWRGRPATPGEAHGPDRKPAAS